MFSRTISLSRRNVWLTLTRALIFQVSFPIQVRHIHLNRRRKGHYIKRLARIIQLLTGLTRSYLEPQSQHSRLEYS